MEVIRVQLYDKQHCLDMEENLKYGLEVMSNGVMMLYNIHPFKILSLTLRQPVQK